MTLKTLVIASALVAAFGVYSAHAQTPAKPVTPAKPTTPPTATKAAAVTPAASPAIATPSGAVAPPGGYPLSSDYVIGPEDMLQITIWKNDSLSRTLPVRPDGKISLPLLHDIQAAGLTPMQLRDKIATALGEFMPHPEVAVTVNDVRSYRVSVLGEVQKPGVLQLKADTTILEALALAGGFRDFASPGKITVIRKDERGNSQKLKFNYNRAIKDSNPDDNILLKSGDVVVVP
jgi:polysaccharide export outer membrane protein